MSLTVKARIWGGFLTILAVLAIVAVMSHLGLIKIGSNVDELGRVGGNTVRILMIDRNVAGLRRNALLLTGSNGDAKAMDRIRELETALKTDLAAAIAETHDPERKNLLETMQGEFEHYAANVDKVAALRAKRDAELNERLNPTGAGMRERITALLDATMAIKDFENAAIIGKAQEQLMLGRINALRFLAQPSEKLAGEATEQFIKSEAALNDQLAHEKDAGRRRETEQVLRMLPTYVAAFGEVSAATFEMDRIIRKENADIAAQLGDGAGKVRTIELRHFDTLQDDTRDTVGSQKATSSILSTLAVLLGLAFAALIARSILGPMAAMTGAMGHLASGQLDTEIPALGRADEIGEMAQAVQVFKQSAIDKKRMEEAQRAAEEASRLAEQEQRRREAAIVAEVAEVAKAASGGDLDRRIDLTGKDGFLLNLCEGVNNLVALTGVALKDVAGVLSAVAEGNLTKRITNLYGGLFDQLKGDVNKTADKLFEIVTNINSSARQIAGAAGEVAAGKPGPVGTLRAAGQRA